MEPINRKSGGSEFAIVVEDHMRTVGDGDLRGGGPREVRRVFRTDRVKTLG